MTDALDPAGCAGTPDPDFLRGAAAMLAAIRRMGGDDLARAIARTHELHAADLLGLVDRDQEGAASPEFGCGAAMILATLARMGGKEQARELARKHDLRFADLVGVVDDADMEEVRAVPSE